jgi:hypothetical protein
VPRPEVALALADELVEVRAEGGRQKRKTPRQ